MAHTQIMFFRSRQRGHWRLNETNPVPADVVTNSGSLGSAANGLGVGNVVQGVPGIVKNSFAFANPEMDITFFGAHVDVPYLAALNPERTVHGGIMGESIADRDGPFLSGSID